MTTPENQIISQEEIEEIATMPKDRVTLVLRSGKEVPVSVLAEAIRELQLERDAAQRHARQIENRFMEAVAHPEDWTNMRARLLAQEAATGIRIGSIFPQRPADNSEPSGTTEGGDK